MISAMSVINKNIQQTTVEFVKFSPSPSVNSFTAYQLELQVHLEHFRAETE